MYYLFAEQLCTYMRTVGVLKFQHIKQVCFANVSVRYVLWAFFRAKTMYMCTMV